MTKEESDKFYKGLKREGYTDKEIAESFVWSIDKTPEEEAEFTKLFSAHIKKHYADMSWIRRNYTRFRIRYLRLKYKFQDWLNK